MKRLVKNAARCKKCGHVLVSRHRHDYVACPCGNAVDGGKDYLKRVGNIDDLEDMSEWEEERRL